MPPDLPRLRDELATLISSWEYAFALGHGGSAGGSPASRSWPGEPAPRARPAARRRTRRPGPRPGTAGVGHSRASSPRRMAPRGRPRPVGHQPVLTRESPRTPAFFDDGQDRRVAKEYGGLQAGLAGHDSGLTAAVRQRANQAPRQRTVWRTGRSRGASARARRSRGARPHRPGRVGTLLYADCQERRRLSPLLPSRLSQSTRRGRRATHPSVLRREPDPASSLIPGSTSSSSPTTQSAHPWAGLIAAARRFGRRRRGPITVVASLATAAVLVILLGGRRDQFVAALSAASAWVLAATVLL